MHALQLPISLPSITHITVLNPVRHTRIFYKLALSQQKMGHWVAIIGQGESTETQADRGIELFCIQAFHRLSWRRFFYCGLIFPKALRLRSDIYTLHSPELLGMGLLLKWLLKARIIYDVHEDYAANIRAAAHYPGWLRKPLASLVRKWELFAMRWVDAVSYAEDCYDNMLNVEPKRRYILPNTFTTQAARGEAVLAIPDQPYLLYTGTIAREWGIFEAIQLWEDWCSIQPIQLVIAGHSHQGELVREIRARMEQSPWKEQVQMIGGEGYVPYVEILNLIRHCRLGLGLYHLLPHIRGKIPTKFYEFMAFDKPLLFPDDPVWRSFDQKHQLGIVWERGKRVSDLISELENRETNPPLHDPASYRWEAQEKVIQAMLSSLAQTKKGLP